MKTFSKVLGGVVVAVVVVLVILRFTGFGPHGRTPGLWLSGNVVTTPVTDWSFTDKIPTVEIETRTWYGIPHSITTNSVYYDGQLYVHSLYPAGVQYPYGRSWNENVARDPHVRIKIGNNLYNCTLVHITDLAVIAGVDQASARKYPHLKIPANGTLQIFHVIQDGAPETASGG